MQVEPNYPDDIIVLIKNKNIYSWYVSEKELWIMNLIKLEKDFDIKMGMLGKPVEEHYIDKEREGLEILDETNIDIFQDRMKAYKVSYQELGHYFQIHPEELYYRGSDEICPDFLINCEQNEFYSFFTEPGSYEYYVPESWNGILAKVIDNAVLNEARNF